ncbi:protein of unknown function [Legionella fallonii LLAP-10]|uniref:Uncharacterized protein n=1 Tax=Legionella fallonii LLAP-10 TaxID=1212491 RepID=A0A098G3R7_9GAMM|nr:protein of unknown function [Legionella fallonii LLAP-10]
MSSVHWLLSFRLENLGSGACDEWAQHRAQCASLESRRCTLNDSCNYSYTITLEFFTTYS